MTNGDVLLVAASAASGDAMRGRFGRLSIVVSDASGIAAVACSSCRRFFADLSSFVFFVFVDLGVFAMVSVDIVRACWTTIAVLYRDQKNVGFTFQEGLCADPSFRPCTLCQTPEIKVPWNHDFCQAFVTPTTSTHRQTIDHLALNPPQTQ